MQFWLPRLLTDIVVWSFMRYPVSFERTQSLLRRYLVVQSPCEISFICLNLTLAHTQASSLPTTSQRFDSNPASRPPNPHPHELAIRRLIAPLSHRYLEDLISHPPGSHIAFRQRCDAHLAGVTSSKIIPKKQRDHGNHSLALAAGATSSRTKLDILHAYCAAHSASARPPPGLRIRVQSVKVYEDEVRKPGCRDGGLVYACRYQFAGFAMLGKNCGL
jgi:hypothetical protein